MIYYRLVIRVLPFYLCQMSLDFDLSKISILFYPHRIRVSNLYHYGFSREHYFYRMKDLSG